MVIKIALKMFTSHAVFYLILDFKSTVLNL